MVHLVSAQSKFEKLIIFDKKNLALREIIIYSFNMPIDINSVEYFLENLLGKSEFSKLDVQSSRKYLSIKGKILKPDLSSFEKIAYADRPFNEKYRLEEVEVCVEYNGAESFGSIEVKYADDDYSKSKKGKMYIMHLQLIDDENKKRLGKLKYDFRQYLHQFYELPKSDITELEKMTIFNLLNGYGPTQSTKDLFDKILLSAELAQAKLQISNLEEQVQTQKKAIEKIEDFQNALTQFFKEKPRFVKKDASGSLAIDITEKDLSDLENKISDCRIQ